MRTYGHPDRRPKWQVSLLEVSKLEHARKGSPSRCPQAWHMTGAGACSQPARHEHPTRTPLLLSRPERLTGQPTHGWTPNTSQWMCFFMGQVGSPSSNHHQRVVSTKHLKHLSMPTHHPNWIAPSTAHPSCSHAVSTPLTHVMSELLRTSHGVELRPRLDDILCSLGRHEPLRCGSVVAWLGARWFDTSP